MAGPVSEDAWPRHSRDLDGEPVTFLAMSGVRKHYGGVRALDGASLECERGEVHALLGANGSGKSTLNKILTGVVAPDAEQIRLRDEPITITGPRDAQRLRIAAVYQELSLVPELSVAANVALATEPKGRLGFLDRDRTRTRAREVMERFRAAFGGTLPVDEPLGNLSPGEQQIVEICKALSRDPEILILDEATASLHKAQVDILFEVVRQLAARDALVIFTSHRLDEIFAVCNRATVLRNGRTIGTVELADTTQADLVRMMTGHAADEALAPPPPHEEPAAERPAVLSVRNLATAKLKDVSFDVHAGEILGLGGLQGQGQSELLAALFGAEPIGSGTVSLEGQPLKLHRPGQAVRAGIAFVPGNRGRQGLLGARPILENLAVPSMARRALAHLLLRQSREERAAREAVEQLHITIGSLTDPVVTLSGGNQQKVVVGKWLLTHPRAVLLDDPTKGIDVEAKEEVYRIIRSLTAEGVAVLFNSSEDRELVELSDRVLVLYEGQVVEDLPREQLSEDRLVAAALRVAEVSG